MYTECGVLTINTHLQLVSVLIKFKTHYWWPSQFQTKCYDLNQPAYHFICPNCQNKFHINVHPTEVHTAVFPMVHCRYVYILPSAIIHKGSPMST